MEGEASVWWFKPLVHSRVSSFEDFAQGLIQAFDGERTKEEQPFSAMEEAAMALEEANAIATNEYPKIHQGMSEVPLFISANNLKNCGNSSLKVPEYTSFAILEHHDCTALCKRFKEQIKSHPHALLMSLIQPLRLGCEPLEDETNHGTFMMNQETNLEP